MGTLMQLCNLFVIVPNSYRHGKWVSDADLDLGLHS